MNGYRILSTLKMKNYYPHKLSVHYHQIRKRPLILRALDLGTFLYKARKYDAILVSNPNTPEMIATFLMKRFISRDKFIVFWDTLLLHPKHIKFRAVRRLQIFLMREIDRFYCNHKDISGYVYHYNIDPRKFYFIPFKANNYWVALKAPTRDGKYVLACGTSHRDYKTFLKAMEKLKYPGKIVAPRKEISRYHGTKLSSENCPKNVKIIFHNFDPKSWNRHLANSRIVVIPIRRDTLQSAGISVCLEAMALGKPVVITKGTSTEGIITEEIAEIVEPEDYHSLANSLKKLWEDKNYRKTLSRRGRKFALALGSSERLVRDILKALYADLQGRHR